MPRPSTRPYQTESNRPLHQTVHIFTFAEFSGRYKVVEDDSTGDIPQAERRGRLLEAQRESRRLLKRTENSPDDFVPRRFAEGRAAPMLTPVWRANKGS